MDCIPSSPLHYLHRLVSFSSKRAFFCTPLSYPVDCIVLQVVSQIQLHVVSNKNLIAWSACQHDKSHQLHFLLSEYKSSVPLELICSDVWRPSLTLSNNDACYLYVFFVDHFSKFTCLYPISYKTYVVFAILRKFMLM
jgi:hypothetical protein